MNYKPDPLNPVKGDVFGVFAYVGPANGRTSRQTGKFVYVQCTICNTLQTIPLLDMLRADARECPNCRKV